MSKFQILNPNFWSIVSKKFGFMVYTFICASPMFKAQSIHFKNLKKTFIHDKKKVKYQGTREITRLDITMQKLIQDIFSQIIDSCCYFPERFCDFSCNKLLFKTKYKVLSHVNRFWSEVYKKCQKWFWMFEAYLKWNFCYF